MKVIQLREKLKRIELLGVGISPTHNHEVVAYFSRPPTKDELQYFIEVMRRATACAPQNG